MSRSEFKNRLAFGQVTESAIGRWLTGVRKAIILPAYEKEIDNGKGPRLFMADGNDLVVPDLLVWCGDGVLRWFEAKHKTHWTWHRITSRWTTGIDLRHYDDYLQVNDLLGHDVLLMFLHVSNQPHKRDREHCPPCCPTGLFGNRLSFLRKHENHRSDKWGKSGMVYWNSESLIKYAPLELIIPTPPAD